MRDNGTSRSQGFGHALRAAAISFAALVATFLLSASPAGALSQHGHISTAISRFSSQGTGAGQMREPRGVAVNEATGDIYVVDSGNHRVDRFNAKGEFLMAFGIGVQNGERKPQVCTTTCLVGRATRGKGNVYEADGIAIDNSTSASDPSKGDVYVETLPFEVEEAGGKEVEREGSIQKFTPDGVPAEKGPQIKSYRWEGFTEAIEEPWGVAVDAAGNLYLYDEEYVVKYNDGTPNKTVSRVEVEPEEEAPGLAVDNAGNIYAGVEFAAGSKPTISEFGPQGGEALLEPIFGAPTAGIAYEQARGDLVLNNETSVAVLNGEKELVQVLGEHELTRGSGVAVNGSTELIYAADAASGQILVFGPEAPGAPIVDGLSATNLTGTTAELSATIDPHGGTEARYSFRFSTGPVPGAGEPCTSPCVESSVAALGGGVYGDVTTAPRKVEGLMPETRYRYRVIVEATVGGEVLTTGSSERSFKTPSVSGSTLPDGRIYEKVSPKEKNGSAFMALQREGAVIQAAANGEGLTYVGAGAIPNSEGNPEPEGNQAAYLTQIFGRWHEGGWSTRDLDVKHEKGEGLFPGNGNNYLLFSDQLQFAALETTGTARKEFPPLTGDPSQERTPYLRQNSLECEPAPALTSCFVPLLSGVNAATGYGGRAVFVGGDASLDHVIVKAETQLTSTATPSGVGLYERTAGDPSFQLVSVLPNGEAASFPSLGFNRTMVDHAVSEGGKRVIFTSRGTEAETPSAPVAEHLYLRDTQLGQTVQLDKQEAGVTIPQGVFTAEPAQYEHPYYQTASADGSVVYFTDEWRLTKDSTSRPRQPDLYACVIAANEAGELECHLHDLTVDSESQSASLQGVLGAGSSFTGGALSSSTIYFVANGRLTEGAQAGQCKPGYGTGLKGEEEDEAEDGGEREARAGNAMCTLYTERYDAATQTWTAPKMVAALSVEDEPDWSSSQTPGVRSKLAVITSRVSPDGEGLAFMSDQNLTGYDTRDAGSGRRDEQVYFYDNHGEGDTVCASCNPSGARPQGVFDQKESGEGIGLVVDSHEIWADRKISALVPGWDNYNLQTAFYQNRYLNDEGRLFFDSAEALVPQDTNGKMDVYEYEPVGVGGCTEESETFHEDRNGCVSLISSGTATHETAFLDASETGDDVFFLTSAQLVEQDKDGGFDVYDATECGSAGQRSCVEGPTSTKRYCTELKTCRPGPEEAPGPVFAPPASTTAVPNGNTGKHEVLGTKAESVAGSKSKPLTKKQKLAKALKACHKLKNHKKRVSCERAARKKYGTTKKAHKSGARTAQRRGRR